MAYSYRISFTTQLRHRKAWTAELGNSPAMWFLAEQTTEEGYAGAGQKHRLPSPSSTGSKDFTEDYSVMGVRRASTIPT